MLRIGERSDAVRCNCQIKGISFHEMKKKDDACVYMYGVWDDWRNWESTHTSVGIGDDNCCSGKACQGNQRHHTCSKRFEGPPWLVIDHGRCKIWKREMIKVKQKIERKSVYIEKEEDDEVGEWISDI